MNAKQIQQVRAKLELSQAGFAKLLGVSVRTLQNWEQSRRNPNGPATAALLNLADSGALKRKRG